MAGWLGLLWQRVVRDLLRELRWSYLPPLMVYFAAGISGLTAIVGTFFVKDYLDLSAAFLAALGFWAGLPWVMKMPLGHLVDLIWERKALMVWAGAALIATSLLIMFFLVTRTDIMRAVLPAGTWYVIAALLAPTGYVIQDVVADAMTVEAVPLADEDGRPFAEAEVKEMHTTMQTLGRFAIISGSVAVAILNIVMFSGAEHLAEAAKVALYGRIYLIALAIPAISVSGVVIAAVMRRREMRRLRARGMAEEDIRARLYRAPEHTEPDWQLLGGAFVFVAFTIGMGLSDLPGSQEIVFAGSLAIIAFLIRELLTALEPDKARMLIGTAIIIFVFRAVPLPGPGQTWFQIDVLGFDEQFFSVLSLITSVLTLAGLLLLRPLMASRSIAWIVVLLSLANGVLTLPNIGLYYGIQEWTARWTGGIVDARFIAIVDTMLESPLGQVAMVPMLAWIARNAPKHLKATFFAVMASFTNLALSASSLGTKYLNEIFVITREVRDPATGKVLVAADYSQLGLLLITTAVISVAAPILTVIAVQHSPLRTTD